MPETTLPPPAYLENLRIEYREGDRKRWRWYAVDVETEKTVFMNANPRGFNTKGLAQLNAERCFARITGPYQTRLLADHALKLSEATKADAKLISTLNDRNATLREEKDQLNHWCGSLKRQCDAWAKKRSFWYRWAVVSTTFGVILVYWIASTC